MSSSSGETKQRSGMLEAHEAYLRLKTSGALNTGRSTMSASNASAIKPYLDEMLRTGQSVLLRMSIFGVSLGTLYRKILDAGTFLAIKSMPGESGGLVKTSAEQQRYQIMKAQWRLEATPEGYIIHPNKFELQERKRILEIQKHIDAAHTSALERKKLCVSWREEFLEFIESAPDDAEFVREDIALMPEDREFIENLCKQANFEFDINEDGTRLVVIKTIV